MFEVVSNTITVQVIWVKWWLSRLWWLLWGTSWSWFGWGCWGSSIVFLITSGWWGTTCWWSISAGWWGSGIIWGWCISVGCWWWVLWKCGFFVFDVGFLVFLVSFDCFCVQLDEKDKTAKGQR